MWRSARAIRRRRPFAFASLSTPFSATWISTWDRDSPASTRPATSSTICTFRGGRYGIVTEKTSPAWQFTVIDSTFEGQKNAAIREHEAGLTLVNVAMSMSRLASRSTGLRRLAVGQGPALRTCTSGRRPDLQREQRLHAGGIRQRAREPDAHVRTVSREQRRTVANSRPMYRVSDFSLRLTVPAMGQPG